MKLSQKQAEGIAEKRSGRRSIVILSTLREDWPSRECQLFLICPPLSFAITHKRPSTASTALHSATVHTHIAPIPAMAGESEEKLPESMLFCLQPEFDAPLKTVDCREAYGVLASRVSSAHWLHCQPSIINFGR